MKRCSCEMPLVCRICSLTIESDRGTWRAIPPKVYQTYHDTSDDLNLGWRILLLSGHRMPKPCKAMGNPKKRYPLLDSSNMIVWTVIWIMNLLYQLRVHARWVSGSKYTSESVPHSIIQVYYPVLQSTPPELPCSTKCYTIESRRLRVCWSDTQSDTKRYPKRCPKYFQYYSVLQSTAPVLLCTAKYYSVPQSTTPYYKVLRQYYSVLQSTTPVLLCTTKYYSVSVLQKYYSVLQTTTPVLLRTTSSSDSSSSSCTEDEEESTWKRLWVLMYTTQLNDTPKSLKRRKLKKAMGDLKCWMALRVNRGSDSSSYVL